MTNRWGGSLGDPGFVKGTSSPVARILDGIWFVDTANVAHSCWRLDNGTGSNLVAFATGPGSNSVVCGIGYGSPPLVLTQLKENGTTPWALQIHAPTTGAFAHPEFDVIPSNGIALVNNPSQNELIRIDLQTGDVMSQDHCYSARILADPGGKWLHLSSRFWAEESRIHPETLAPLWNLHPQQGTYSLESGGAFIGPDGYPVALWHDGSNHANGVLMLPLGALGNSRGADCATGRGCNHRHGPNGQPPPTPISVTREAIPVQSSTRLRLRPTPVGYSTLPGPSLRVESATSGVCPR